MSKLDEGIDEATKAAGGYVEPRNRVKPIELWCWKCPICCNAEIMGTVAATDRDFDVLTCDRCNKQFEVELPG